VPKFVYQFAEGHKDLKDLLGGKGANLAEMTRMGLPVPPGFTITTEACTVYLSNGQEPCELRSQVDDHLGALEATMGKKLGQSDDPLLVSVRSGARFSMPGIMIPLVGAVEELAAIRGAIIGVARNVWAETGANLDFLIGTMIELPRAALTAGQIAKAAEFFSFGTNDLTQTTWGFSRDDVEAGFFAHYLEKGIFDVSPFESLDRDGVGELVRIAAERGRSVRPGLKLGVCGEHGGDPRSIHFFDSVGLDYVSCSPFRVPVARLECGRATGAVGRIRADRYRKIAVPRQ